ncbi:MAG: patatin-like phospholipase family protein [Candidatus Zhuqueibacterota bacterium]
MKHTIKLIFRETTIHNWPGLSLRSGLIFLLIALALSTKPVSGQETPYRPKVGLALSGGGAKGFAHIGVLKVLEEIDMPIDYIAGTSMGSVVGALYAMGYKAREIEKIALSTYWPDLLTDEHSRRFLSMEEKLWDGKYLGVLSIREKKVMLPAGLIAGQKITDMLSKLAWPAHHINDFSQLPIPFACVATDIGTGEAVVLDEGFLPDAIRASMAIPTVFTPILIDKRLLVDGGLVRNLPAEDVKNMGADIVIGVDVSYTLLPLDKLNSFLDIITQSLSFVEAKSRLKQREICNYLIEPNMEGLDMFSFTQVQKIIQRGEEAALDVLPQIYALVDSFQIAKYEPGFIPAKIDSFYIHDFTIEGLHDVSQRLVLAELNFKKNSWISSAELDEAISRLYSTQFFERVTYKLIPLQNGIDLIIRVFEKTADVFRFGLRYESTTKSSLTMNTTFRNLAEHGSLLALDLTLGQRSQIDVFYFLHTGLLRTSGFQANVNYLDESIDIFQQKQRIARLSVKQTTGELFLGSIFSTTVMSGMGVRAEFARIRPRIGPEYYQVRDEKYMSVFGRMWLDTFNRAVFPDKGHSLKMSATFASKRIGSDLNFTHYLFDWQGRYPLDSRWAVMTRIQLGTTIASDLPISYTFFIGGADSFVGYKYRERLAKHMQALYLGLQYEMQPRRFLQLHANIGNSTNIRSDLFDRNRFISGIGASFGVATPIGPLEFTVMGSEDYNFMTYFNIGYKF